MTPFPKIRELSKNVTVYGLTASTKPGFPLSGVVHQKAVRPAFQETLDLVHPALAHHLREGLQLGTTCCYRPTEPTRWSLR